MHSYSQDHVDFEKCGLHFGNVSVKKDTEPSRGVLGCVLEIPMKPCGDRHGSETSPNLTFSTLIGLGRTYC